MKKGKLAVLLSGVGAQTYTLMRNLLSPPLLLLFSHSTKQLCWVCDALLICRTILDIGEGMPRQNQKRRCSDFKYKFPETVTTTKQ